MKPDLNGEAALVTGAAKGIGKAAADVLAENGAKLIYPDRDAVMVAAVARAGYAVDG